MRVSIRAVLVLLLAVPLLAEAGLFGNNSPPKDASGLSLGQRVELLERRMDTLSNIVLRLDTMQQELQQIRGQMEEQKHAMAALKKRQRDLYLDIDQRIARLSGEPIPERPPEPPPSKPEPPTADMAPKPSTPTPPAAAATSGQEASASNASAPASSESEAQEYQTAFNLLMQSRYPEARKAFQGFLARYPQGGLADNAQYWLAESYYVSKDYATAMQEFAVVMQKYPQSSKVPDSMLKSGFIKYEGKQWAEARQQLEDLVSRYPGVDASQLAQKRLDRMLREGH